MRRSKTGSPRSTAARTWRWCSKPRTAPASTPSACPGSSLTTGFSIALLGHMQTIADKLQKENWVLGASGDQGAVKQQYVSLFPGILELYGRDFIAAWTAAINNLQLKPLLNDKPKYLKLSAASALTSPIRSDFRIHSRRNGADARASQAAGQSNAAADQAKQDALAAAPRPAGHGRARGDRPGDEVAAQGGRSAAGGSRALRSRPISSPSRSWSTASRARGRSTRCSQISTNLIANSSSRRKTPLKPSRRSSRSTFRWRASGRM